MDAIEQVSMIGTGTVRIRPEFVESDGTPIGWWLLTSRRWTAPRPINVFVIEHEQGLVLFDTGQDRRSVTDPTCFPRGTAGLLYSRLARFVVRPEETLAEHLRALGHDIADVRLAVLSHLHRDHIGGLPEPGEAEILVWEVEWAGLGRRFPELDGLLKRHIQLPGLRWTRVTPPPVDDPSIVPFTAAQDLFGGGSLLLVSTPGHTHRARCRCCSARPGCHRCCTSVTSATKSVCSRGSGFPGSVIATGSGSQRAPSLPGGSVTPNRCCLRPTISLQLAR